MRRADERTMFAVTLFVLVTGSSWRDAGWCSGCGRARRIERSRAGRIESLTEE